MKFLRRMGVLFLAALMSAGCSPRQNKYSYTFLGCFDTVITLTAYASDREQFDRYCSLLQNRTEHLNALYDIYNDYPNLNNLKTINDHAGKEAIPVEKEIIDLLKFSQDWYEHTDGQLNIALGPVLKIWYDYREAGVALPSMDELQTANEHTDIRNIIIDTQQSTVFVADPLASIDVGAVAKGYAMELVANELRQAGLTSFILNGGGNVVAGSPPEDGRSDWNVAIQSPDDPDGTIDMQHIHDSSAVTSGGYQRYYIYEGKRYHHIISPESLFPADYYRSVTILCKESGVADALSTACYTLPEEQMIQLLGKLNQLPEISGSISAVYMLNDGTLHKYSPS